LEARPGMAANASFASPSIAAPSLAVQIVTRSRLATLSAMASPCDCGNAAVFAGLAARLPRDAVWITSGLQRTHQTAAAIVRAGLPGPDPIPGPGVVVEQALNEQSFGEWHGKKYSDLPALLGEAYHRFWLAPVSMAPAGGESFLDLLERVRAAVSRSAMPGATSSPSPMAARYAAPSPRRSISPRKWRSPSPSTIARSPISSVTTAPATVTRGASPRSTSRRSERGATWSAARCPGDRSGS